MVQDSHNCIIPETTEPKIKGVQFSLDVPLWTPYLPDTEVQTDTQTDFADCATESGIHMLEIVMNYLISSNQLPSYHLQAIKNLGFMSTTGKFEASVRFSATQDGTTKAGNYISAVLNSISASDGIVASSAWQYDLSMSWDEYYSVPSAQVIAMGKTWLSLFNIEWDWLLTNTGNNNLINQNLSQSPVQIAVHVCPTWNTNDPVLMCNDTTLQHCVSVYGDQNGNYQIRDTYNPFNKELSGNYNVPCGTQIKITPIPFSYEFTKSLKFGMSDPDVLQLQRALNQDPDTMVATSGIGSPGLETGNFGVKTLNAVNRFQQKYASVILTPADADAPTGFCGSHTLAQLNALWNN